MTSTLRKSDLVTIAREIGSSTEGTKSSLLTSIRETIAADARLSGNPRYAVFVRPVSRSSRGTATTSATTSGGGVVVVEEPDSDSAVSDVGDLAHLGEEVREAGHEASAAVHAASTHVKESAAAASETVQDAFSDIHTYAWDAFSAVRTHVSSVFAINAFFVLLEAVLLLSDVRADPKLGLPNDVYLKELKLVHLGYDYFSVFVQHWLKAALPLFTHFIVLRVLLPLVASAVINFTQGPADPLTFAVARYIVGAIFGDSLFGLPAFVGIVYALYAAALH